MEDGPSEQLPSSESSGYHTILIGSVSFVIKNRYQRLEKIGSGAYGIVVSGIDTAMNNRSVRFHASPRFLGAQTPPFRPYLGLSARPFPRPGGHQAHPAAFRRPDRREAHHPRDFVQYSLPKKSGARKSAVVRRLCECSRAGGALVPPARVPRLTRPSPPALAPCAPACGRFSTSSRTPSLRTRSTRSTS